MRGSGSLNFTSNLRQGLHRDEATGPQEHDPATDSGDRQLLNGRLSSRPPRAVYYMNSLFWTTSSFSDNYKILLSWFSVKSD